MAASTKPRTPTAPAKLGRAGGKLWREIVALYELRPDELRILEDACREADLIETLTTEQGKQQVMIKGSMGQLVLNPLIAEVRQHRSTLSGLLQKLKLPDDPTLGSAGGGEPTGKPVGDERATKARAAAQARWSRRGA